MSDSNSRNTKSSSLVFISVLLLQVACARMSTAGDWNGETNLASTQASTSTDLGASIPAIAECSGMDATSCDAFKAINAQRIAQGLSALSFCQTCAAMASAHSEDMSTQNYFSTNSPTQTLSQTIAQYGLQSGAAESIAQGLTGSEAASSWMSTASDSANILNPSFKSLGVGVFGQYITAVFYVGTDK